MAEDAPTIAPFFGSVDETLDTAIAQELDADSSPVATGWRRLVYAVLSNRNLTITLAAVIVFAFFSLATRQFLSPNNLLNIVRNMSLTGIVAVGMTFVLVSGEIDLSVGSVYGVLTVILGLCFTSVQAYEYAHAAFHFTEGIYPSTFFMATGFHGAHVLIGTTFLIVCLIRAYKGHFTPTHHLGFEFCAWYWHFVDVVWLFLFACIYVWGGGASAG